MKDIFSFFFFFFFWGFPELIHINWWIYWSNKCCSSLIFIYLSLVLFLSTSDNGTEWWVEAMCYGLLFAKFEPESRKVKREQRWLFSILQDRQAPEIEHKSKAVQLTWIATLRVEGICQLGLPLGLVCSPKPFHQPAAAEMGGGGWWWERTCWVLLEVGVGTSL